MNDLLLSLGKMEMVQIITARAFADLLELTTADWPTECSPTSIGLIRSIQHAESLAQYMGLDGEHGGTRQGSSLATIRTRCLPILRGAGERPIHAQLLKRRPLKS